MCAKMIINAGIDKVIYEGDYPDEFSLELFREAGTELYRYISQNLERVQ
jgi:dCMP deaminase